MGVNGCVGMYQVHILYFYIYWGYRFFNFNFYHIYIYIRILVGFKCIFSFLQTFLVYIFICI